MGLDIVLFEFLNAREIFYPPKYTNENLACEAIHHSEAVAKLVDMGPEIHPLPTFSSHHEPILPHPNGTSLVMAPKTGYCLHAFSTVLHSLINPRNCSHIRPISQLRKLRLREIKNFAQGHKTS